MIEFENVSFSYGRKPVLKDFSLFITAGERVCFFGPSGCGKTTVLRLIAGLEKPKSGKITVNSKNIRVSFQEDRLLPFLTVKENVSMFAEDSSADEVLSRLGLNEAKYEYPSQLSGGMSKRVSIARSLAAEGDIYIFDEPFNGLDEENIEKAANLINEKTKGKTVISVLHDREYAGLIGCRIVMPDLESNKH